MAMKGARVVLACRDIQKCQVALDNLERSTGSNNFSVGQLDLTDVKSIQTFASSLDRCDILVNNAGAMFPNLTYKSFLSTETEQTFLTNYIGPFLLTMYILPILQRTSIENNNSEVRIVNVSSRLEKKATIPKDINDRSDGLGLVSLLCQGPSPYSLWTSYGNSKLCNVLFTSGLYLLLQQHPPWKEKGNVTVVAMTPGLVNSSLSRWAPSYWLWLSYPIRPFLMRSCDQAAADVTFVATSPILKNMSGKFVDGQGKVVVGASPAVNDQELIRQLWDQTADLLAPVLSLPKWK